MVHTPRPPSEEVALFRRLRLNQKLKEAYVDLSIAEFAFLSAAGWSRDVTSGHWSNQQLSPNESQSRVTALVITKKWLIKMQLLGV
jgi:hypothetical protein